MIRHHEYWDKNARSLGFDIIAMKYLFFDLFHTDPVDSMSESFSLTPVTSVIFDSPVNKTIEFIF